MTPSRNRVLLVDDQQTALLTLSLLFKSFGWETHQVNSGKAALRALVEQEFDLVLTDLRMPEMDGVALIRQIRKICGPTDPVAFLFTGFADQANIELALAAGAQLVLHKPIGSQHLHEALKTCGLSIAVERRPIIVRPVNRQTIDRRAATVMLNPINRSF